MTAEHSTGTNALRVVFGSDGRILLDALEASVTVASMRDWMRARFAQADPLVQLNEDQMEPPHELFVDLWKRSGANLRLRECMNQATADLLPDAWAAGAADWVESFLRFVETVTPPNAQPFLSRVVQTPEFEPALKDGHLDLRWLGAAASYRSQGSLVDAWKALLEQKRYAQVAYFALREDIELGVRTLPALFRALSEKEQPLLIRQALRWLFGQKEDRARTFLAECWDEYGKVPGLCETVEQALSDLGRLPIKRSSARASRPGVFKPNAVEKTRSPIFTFSNLISAT